MSSESKISEKIMSPESDAAPEKKMTSDAAPEKKMISDIAPEKKMISLKTSDGETFEIEEVVAAESLTLKHMIEDDCADNAIPLPNVTSRILAKVIEYCKKHVEASAKASGEGAVEGDGVVDKDLKNFDAEFVKEDLTTLMDILLVANYLNIKKLFDFASQTVADSIKDKSVEEVREAFNIENDYTPEEEAQIRKDDQWAFE